MTIWGLRKSLNRIVGLGAGALALALGGCGLQKQSHPDIISFDTRTSVSTADGSNGTLSGKAAFQALQTDMRTTVNCNQCHTSGGIRSSDPFADPSVDVGYSAAKINAIVDFNNVSGSKVLTFLQNNHCGITTICGVQDGTIIKKFLTDAQTWANAENSASGSTSGGVTITGLGTYVTVAAQIPAASGDPTRPTAFQVPLTGLSSKIGASGITFNLTCLTKKVVNGIWVCLYSMSNPVLNNRLTQQGTIVLAGFDLALDGTYDSVNRPFADTTLNKATATLNQNIAFPGSGALLFWGNPTGNLVKLYIQQLTAP